MAAAAAPTEFPILIRSVSPNAGSEPAGEYVMLQMTVDGQQHVAGETLTFYGPGGGIRDSFVIPADVANGQSHRTILLSTPQAGSPTPDFTLDTGDALDPAAGALCRTGEFPSDCVSWGTFPEAARLGLPDPQFGNAEEILGIALARLLGGGCGSWLGPQDDVNYGQTDFLDGVPIPPRVLEPPPPPPRSNSAGVGDTPCVPNTGWNAVPLNPTNDTTPSFAFGETPPEYGVGFECRFVTGASMPPGKAWTPCSPSGVTFGPLADGLHTFQARAVGYAGPDPSPLSWTFEVDTVPPETTITKTPEPISSGFSASFSFVASEPEPGFTCRLDNGPVQVCAPGETYFFLSEGTHTFRVWASDQATNQDPSPALHNFVVDTSFGDGTPPFTEILTGPSKNSKTAAARFSYSSNEPGSRFECRVDAEPFSACEPTGRTYSGLRNGRHTFAVRAIDRAGNADSSPALHTWTIEAASPETEIVKAPPGVTRLKAGKRRAGVLFAFRSTRSGSRFHCRLDDKPFRPCESPRRLRVGPGRHRFEVYATDALGNRDDVPAKRIFRVMKKGASKGVFG